MENYRKHRFFQEFMSQSPSRFQDYLLQLEHVSQRFAEFYRGGKTSISDPETERIIEEMIKDDLALKGKEGGNRTHDLTELAGVTALKTPPSVQTRAFLEELLSLPDSCPPKPPRKKDRGGNRAEPSDEEKHRQHLWTVVVLRVAGEILPAEQFRLILDYLEQKMGVDRRQTRYFLPKYELIRKDVRRTDGSHGHRFDKLVDKLIRNERDLDLAKQAVDIACRVRSEFHDQFLPEKVPCFLARLTRAFWRRISHTKKEASSPAH
ncbi:MAG TPA: hypothetical protein VEB60_01560 [Candidatus Paceibacterota bacterium]|nr:hypothetical protein [Candidatus Paceibacterota bacterium]